MNNFGKRVVTGLSLVAGMVICVYWSSNSLFLLFLLLNFLGLWEFQTLLEPVLGRNKKQAFEEKMLLLLFGGILYTLTVQTFLGNLPSNSIILILPIIFLLFIKELFSKAERPFVNIAFDITSLLYITIPCILVNLIGNFEGTFSPNIIVGIFLLVWLNDSGAYFSGKWLGKTPLFKRISPKKTWEGYLGGTIVGFVAAFLLSRLFDDLTPNIWYGLAAITSVFGSLGDLVESLLKRSLGVKDSGDILPGHGGILDRFDALLFSMPFVFAFVYLWG